MSDLRLTHPALDFWVDVRLREIDGVWVAVADLADQPEIAVSRRLDLALLLALWPLGGAVARRLVSRALEDEAETAMIGVAGPG